ncbi:MAG: tryptophan-rich sensory protein [Oscillospiraceae bacterium]|nr:tryptophan-rich sensory protein [Oscillospiraceae bacterium]
MASFWTKYRAFIVNIIIALAVGGVSAFSVYGSMREFDALIKPPLMPPSWVFSVVWTALFILMGISAALVWRSGGDERGSALTVYAVQLAMNFLWSIFFFRLGARLLAFFWLLFLLALVLLMISLFRAQSKCAARLQLPYAVWLVFAGYLNLAVYLLNG